MHTDLPLSNQKEDKLGRYLFAQEIANGLVNSFEDNTDSVVLGINGSWGSGKSTLINFILIEVERLANESNKDIIILKFNPWMFSGQKELQNIFLKELYLKFESQKDKLKKASKRLADFLGHLNWLKYVHTGAGDAVKDAKLFLDGLAKAKDLYQIKNDIDQLLIKSKVKLYITIDDIDRLTPSEITDIFQLVKLNGNFANTVFLLAYDQEVVTVALDKKFGSNGRKYIEKIVQVDYTLPSISRYDISRIFIDNLQSLFIEKEINEAIDKSFEDIQDEPFVSLFTSLRDVYRFNNSIKLRLPSIYRELNIRDFFLIECLRVFRPEAYQFALNSKEELTFKNRNGVIKVNLSHTTNKEESKSEYIDNQQFDNISKTILKSLFAFDGFQFYDTSNEELIRDKRIANPNYFDRYFNLQLGNFDIQEQVFEKFIEQSELDHKIEILTEVFKKEQLLEFLNWVEIKGQFTELKNIEAMVFACFSFSDTIKYRRETIFSMGSEIITILRFCSRVLDRVKTPLKRRQIVERHISGSEKQLSFSSIYTCNNILRSKYLLDKGELSVSNLWYGLFSQDSRENVTYEKQVLKYYKSAIKKVFVAYTKDPSLLNGEELIFILPMLKEYHGKFYDKAFQNIITADKDLLNIIMLCITRDYVSTGNVTGFPLAKKQLLHGMDIEQIKTRLEKINKSDLNKDEIATVKFYLKAYEDGFVEKRYYDFYTLKEIKFDR